MDNDHSHIMIWFCVLAAMFNWFDCNGSDKKIRELNDRIHVLEGR